MIHAKINVRDNYFYVEIFSRYGVSGRFHFFFFFSSVTEYSDGPGISQRDVFRAVGI